MLGILSGERLDGRSAHQMEFILESDARKRALVAYLLGRAEKLDEKEMSDPKLAQEVFLLKYRQELSQRVEEKIVHKILEDIDLILRESCPIGISELDFYHVHLCSFSPFPIFDLGILLSEDNVCLLYHTCERWFSMPQYAKRNIKSTLNTPAEVIPLKIHECTDNNGHKSYWFPKAGVGSDELGWSEWGQIRFEQDPNGLYKLDNGTTLRMTGVLPGTILRYTKVHEGGQVVVDGKLVENGRKKAGQHTLVSRFQKLWHTR